MDRPGGLSYAKSVAGDPLALFHAPTRAWFEAVFTAPTRPQALGWPAIARGDSTLILAPTGTGKTLAAFQWCIDRLMFAPVPAKDKRCRVLYISPIKALAVDVERNLRAPLAGIAMAARAEGVAFHEPTIAIRTGDTPAAERARFARRPADILITTPESIYLLLTSNAREVLRSVETVVLDEIHALVPTKRGSHLALSLERLEALCGRKLQRIGLSATQRPLDEVARFLGGAVTAAAGKKERAGDATQEILAEFESAGAAPKYREVTIVDASAPKRIDLRVEVPIDDMTKLDELVVASGPASAPPVRPSIWSAIHPEAAGAGAGAHFDADLHQQPAAGGAHFGSGERAGGRDAGAGASWQRGCGAAQGDRGPAEDGDAAGPRGDVVVGAGDRHGRDRSGGADRGAALGGERNAASGAREPSGGRGERGGDVPEVSRRFVGVRGDHAGDVPGQGGVGALSAESAGRAGAADRRDGGDGRVGRGRAVRAGAAGGAVRGADTKRVRFGARYVERAVSLGRIRGIAAASDVGPGERATDLAAGRAEGGGGQRRHDSRSRTVRRVPDGGDERGAGRRAG